MRGPGETSPLSGRARFLDSLRSLGMTFAHPRTRAYFANSPFPTTVSS
jgi:hypothetical protein